MAPTCWGLAPQRRYELQAIRDLPSGAPAVASQRQASRAPVARMPLRACPRGAVRGQVALQEPLWFDEPDDLDRLEHALAAIDGLTSSSERRQASMSRTRRSPCEEPQVGGRDPDGCRNRMRPLETARAAPAAVARFASSECRGIRRPGDHHVGNTASTRHGVGGTVVTL